MKRALLTFLGCILLFSLAGKTEAKIYDWTSHGPDEIEFGITSTSGGIQVNDPWVLETGYNGAWWFGGTHAMGQTFSVGSDSILSSVTLRLSSASATTGLFEIGVWVFDSVTETTTIKLASFIGDASNYQRGLQGISQSTFDMSSFNAFLDHNQKYMLSLTALWGTVGNFYVQAEIDTYSGGGAFYGTYERDPEPIAIDIKPRSCPNPVNTKSKGVLPVAILGTDEFDVTKIDPATVLLEGVAPLRWSMKDVAAPYAGDMEGCDTYACTELPHDGYLDLTLKFKNQEVVAAIGEVEDGECRKLELTGNLKEEFGSVPFAGEDVALILKNKKKKKKK